MSRWSIGMPSQAFLKAVDWQVVSSVATAGALLVSASVFRVQLIDRRRLRADQNRAQAEQVSGWLTFDREERTWIAHVLNGSIQPVYDVLYVVRDLNNADTDAADPEIIPVIPPETAYSWEPTFLSAELFGMPEDEVKDEPKSALIYAVGGREDRPLYVGSIRNLSGLTNRVTEGRINHRAYMTFWDGRGLTWQRDSRGRLSPTRRPVDWAPRTSRITGRISWWFWGERPVSSG